MNHMNVSLESEESESNGSVGSQVADAAAEAAGSFAMRAALEADLTLEQVADEAVHGSWRKRGAKLKKH